MLNEFLRDMEPNVRVTFTNNHDIGLLSIRARRGDLWAERSVDYTYLTDEGAIVGVIEELIKEIGG